MKCSKAEDVTEEGRWRERDTKRKKGIEENMEDRERRERKNN